MRMTVCYLENGTSGGGSFESLLQLVQHIDRDRFEPVVIFANVTPHFERFRALGVRASVIADPIYSSGTSPWVRAGAAGVLAATRRHASMIAPYADALMHRASIRALRRIMAAHRAALLHCNNQPLRDAYGMVAARTLGVPVICHLRSIRVGAMGAPVTQWLGRSVTHAIANSQFTKDWWTSNGGIPSSRMTVIPNPVARTAVDAVDVRAEWGIPRAARVIACVANFTEGKGHRMLLEAFIILRRQMPDVTLLLVGDGPLRASVVTHAMERGCADAVRFVGYDPRARAIIAGCDVLAVPSEMETFGRTVIEAFSGGVPVVATDVGGIPELIPYDGRGLLVPSGDADAFAAALVRVLRDRAFAATCREAGRRVVASGWFDPTAHAAAVVHVYNGVLTHIPA